MRLRNIIFITLTLVYAWLTPLVYSQETFNTAINKAQLDLEDSLLELSKLRDSISSEKIPLLNSINESESSLKVKQRELNSLLRLRDNSDISLDRLKDQVKALNEQNDYLASLLDEFVRTFETRIDFSELQIYESIIEEARLVLDDPDASQFEKFEKQIDVVSSAINRLGNLVGGHAYPGLALAPNGNVVDGKFVAYGPAVYFNSNDSLTQGITVTRLNSAEAAISNPGENFNDGLINFVKEGEGSIPVDVTLGKALKIVESNETIIEHLAKGGSVGTVIIALGIICLIIGAYKAFEITTFNTPRYNDVQNILKSLESNNLDQAKTKAKQVKGLGGELLHTAIKNYKLEQEHLEEILYEKTLSSQPLLERFLPFMALTAAAAPLLGLLGTVTGMIKTFNLITIFGTGDAKSLSSGISEALVTTELGLIVAIPALIFHGLLFRMSKQKTADLEQASVSFINGINGLKENNIN